MIFKRKKERIYKLQLVVVASLVMIFGSLAVTRFVGQGTKTTAASEEAFEQTSQVTTSTNRPGGGYIPPATGGGTGGGGGGSGTPLYFITYELNGRIQGPGELLAYTSKMEVELPIPTKDGETFGGWYETPDFSTAQVTNIPLGSIKDKTFYAKWGNQSTYKIVYNAPYSGKILLNDDGATSDVIFNLIFREDNSACVISGI